MAVREFLIDLIAPLLRLGGASGPTITSGSGSPEGAVTAPIGSVFLRTDGGANTTHYRKESGAGNTGWVSTIADDAVTFAKMLNASGASVLVGRGSLAGAGDFQEVTLGANLTMAGTVLSASGGAAGSVSMGLAVVDFGAFPGASDAKVDVVGLAMIVAGSKVSATVVATATADHSADEHWVETIAVTAGNIIAATGFTIYAKNTGLGDTRLYGQWNVAYSWAA